MVRKKQSSPPPKFFSFILSFLRIFLVGGAIICGLLVVVFLFVSQIETKLTNQNILFIPNNKDVSEGQIILASVNGNSQKVFVYQFPTILKAEVLGGYGEYPLGSVLPLLKIDHKDNYFVQAAFSGIFQHSVTNFYEHQIDSEQLGKAKLISLLLKQRQTWSLAWQIYKLDGTSLSFKRVENWEEWGKALSGQLVGSINDHCSVAVVNTTKINGLATKLSNVLEKSGVEVVRTTDSIWDQSATAIYYADESALECESVINVIQSVSPVKLLKNTDEVKPTQYRAKVVFFIGNELAEIFGKESTKDN